MRTKHHCLRSIWNWPKKNFDEGGKKYNIFLCRGGGLLFCQKTSLILMEKGVLLANIRWLLHVSSLNLVTFLLHWPVSALMGHILHPSWRLLYSIDHPSKHSLQRPATFHQKALYGSRSGAVGIHEVMKCTREEIVLGKNTGKLPTLSDKVTHRAMHIVSKHIWHFPQWSFTFDSNKTISKDYE